MARRLHSCLGRYLDRHIPCASEPLLNNKRPVQTQEGPSLNRLLSSLGHRDPAKPLFMLESFLSAGVHLSAEDFAAVLKGAGRDTSPEEAGQALELFCALGFAQKLFTEDGRPFYEYLRPDLHHDHILCSGCGQTVEFHQPLVDNLIETIACDENFSQLSHRLIIYGLCPECRRRRQEGIPLTEAASGEVLRVLSLTGSEEIKKRLEALGLRRGSALRILGGQTGAVIVMLEGCRLAMGPDLAAAVMVRGGKPETPLEFEPSEK